VGLRSRPHLLFVCVFVCVCVCVCVCVLDAWKNKQRTQNINVIGLLVHVWREKGSEGGFERVTKMPVSVWLSVCKRRRRAWIFKYDEFINFKHDPR
jgi:hypothetical protein